MRRSVLYVFCKPAALVSFWLFMPYRTTNVENMSESSGVTTCYNHPTLRDLILPTTVAGKGQVNFMAKMELLKNPLLSSLLRKVGAFIVNYGKGDPSTINHTQELPQEEQVIGIFIEGTRLKDGAFLQPKPGAMMLASQNNMPTLPVCITGRRDIFPRLFHRVDVAYGPLIMPEQLQTGKDLGSEYHRVSRLIVSRITELRGPALALETLKGEEPQ